MPRPPRPPGQFLSRPGFCMSARSLRLRRIGKPASWRIESWRVKSVRSLVLTPPIANDRPGLRPPPPPAAALALRALSFVTM